MLAKIDDFTFEVTNASYNSLKRSMDYRFNAQQRISNHDYFQDISKYEESIELKGVLLLKSQSQLKDLEDMAKEKKERLLVFTNGTCKTVIILTLELEQSNFLKDGAFLKQSFKINLAVIEK